jgi:hypothetical protein
MYTDPALAEHVRPVFTTSGPTVEKDRSQRPEIRISAEVSPSILQFVTGKRNLSRNKRLQ